jgi:hypothetical protein
MNHSEFCLIACVLFLLSASNVAGLQTLPSINEPDDITYAEGEIGNVIEWLVSHSSPLHYSIHRNNTVVRSEDLGGNSGSITVSVDGLSMAVYFFVVIVDDFGDNVSTDLVIVTVLQEETTYPTGNGVDPLILVIGVSGAVFAGAIVVLALFRQRR